MSDPAVPVRVATDGPVAIVTIDRPERRNAVDGHTAGALLEAFSEFAADDALSVAVLTGAGGTFCAGADLKAILEAGPRRGSGTHTLRPDEGPLGPTRMLIDKPLIAAVEGHAVAGGSRARVVRPAGRGARRGVRRVLPALGCAARRRGTVRLPRLIGHSHALDLILTGRGVSGDEALHMGLANRLTEPGGALDGALELAHELARLPQQCLREDRASSYEQWGMPLDAALRNEHEHGMKTLSSPDFLAGVARFGAGEGRHGAPA